jgi:hypothetical protein
VQFRITSHSGFTLPPGALELLLGQLGESRDDFSFALVGSEIQASSAEDAPVSMTRDERAEIGRRTILEFLSDACEGTPELSMDWFAVSSEL